MKDGETYKVTGNKTWITHAARTHVMTLLARTDPNTTDYKGLSMFLAEKIPGTDADPFPTDGMTGGEIEVLGYRGMKEYELAFDGFEVKGENLLGCEEGKGFKYILDGLNAERTLIAAECIGDGYWFIDRVTQYVKERTVFGRPIGQNQGVQFPIADAYMEVEAANLMRYKACDLFDKGEACGAEANMAKYLAAKASWEAGNACLQFHGGFGFAHEYDVERKFRETRLYQVAPISTNLIYAYIAEHVLDLPRSF